MSSRGGDAGVFDTMVKGNEKNASYDEGSIKEEKMEQWAKWGK